MKKISKALVTWALISLIIVPIVASAQMPKECCKVNRTYPDFSCDGTGTPGASGFQIVGSPPEKTLSGEAVCPEGKINCPTKKWGIICLMETVYNITDWTFYILLSVAAIIGIVAGVQFMTSSGDPAKTEKARNLLLYMLIGLIIAALAKVIPAIVRTMVGI